MQGWITTFAWTCNVASAMSILANTASGLIIFNHPTYEPQRWHMTLLLIGFLLTLTICNLGLRRVLNTLENFGGALHILLFVVVVAVLLCLSETRSPKFVFNTLTTESGWDSPGVAWSIGLLNSAYPISSFDSVLHMSMYVDCMGSGELISKQSTRPRNLGSAYRTLWCTRLFSTLL
jgi:hypothetical protein